MFEKNLDKLNQIQEKAVELIKEKKKILLNWETGIGKTLPALKAAAEIGGQWLWVMSQNIQEKNIKAECETFNVHPDLKFVNYRSLHKHEDKYYTGIILDEAHRMTELTADSLNFIKHEYCILLSASVSYERRLILKENARYEVSWRITLKEGMKLGIIPPLKIVGIEVPMSLDDELYDVALTRYGGAKKAERISFTAYTSFYFATKVIVENCTLEQYLEVLEREMEYWKKEYDKRKQDWIRDTRWLPLGARRKRVLASFKARFIPYIQTLLEGSRYVIFNENIKQVEDQEGEMIHSQQHKDDNLDAVKKFNEGQTNILTSVRMLNEGMNLHKIDAIVILSLTSTDIQNIQRRGRSVRGIQPTVYVLYVPGTKDEENFKKFTQEYDEHTKIVSINEFIQGTYKP